MGVLAVPPLAILLKLGAVIQVLAVRARVWLMRWLLLLPWDGPSAVRSAFQHWMTGSP
jgi:hypothetical protein